MQWGGNPHCTCGVTTWEGCCRPFPWFSWSSFSTSFSFIRLLAIPSSVEHNGEVFGLWFSCNRGKRWRVSYAESQDGIHFKWWPKPVLDVSPWGWDQEMTCYPSNLRLGERTLMFYAGSRSPIE